MGNHKNTIQNFPRAHQNHRDNHMACSKVKKVNLKKNDFSRLKKTKTQQILVNKFMRESIVAVSKLNTKYAVMLITASYCLSAVEANDNNQTDFVLSLRSSRGVEISASEISKRIASS